MPSKPNPIAEQNLIFAGLGLQLGILSKDKVIRAFTEWLFDKSKPLVDILIQQKALSSEEANSLKVAVQAHIQKEGDQEKALASLHVVKDLESDLDHLGDNDLHQTLDSAVHQRKEMGLDEQFARSHQLDQSQISQLFQIQEPGVKDRFERKSFLDAGALGEVYLAHDRELNRRVVTKYIKPENADIKHNQALFLLEGEVTGALEHPGIVPVYGLGKDIKGRFFYAMRYIQGKKLSRVIGEYHSILNSNSGKKHEAFIDLLQNFQSACLAIEYAHKKGVLHCDIKPDNIMIGDYGEVFVVDWGLVIIHGDVSRAESRNEDEPKTLDIGEVPPYRPSDAASSGLHWNQGGSRKGIGGTPSYIAPEQLRAHNNDDVSLLGPPSDIYALGGTLFQILTGKPPHQFKRNSNDNMKDFNQRILEGVFPRPTELNSQTPKSLEAISLKALSLDPKNRYASARELADDVKRYLADEPVKAHEETFLEKSLRFGRKNRLLVGVAAALLLCIGIGGIIFGFITEGYNEKLLISEREAKSIAKIAESQKKIIEKQLYITKIQAADSALRFGDRNSAYNHLARISFQSRGWEHDFLQTWMDSCQSTIQGHKSWIYSVNFSPDGKKIVSGSSDETIKIWDATSGREIRTLERHTNAVNSVSFSPDGKKIVSGSSDETIKIWDASTGKEIATLKGHTGPVRCVNFSPDGKKIVSGSDDSTLKIWDASTGKEINTFKGHTAFVTTASFSPDGKKIGSGSNDRTIKIWDVVSGKNFLTINWESDVSSLSFSPDGKKIVSGGMFSDKIKVFDATKGKEIQTLEGHIHFVNNVIFSPDAKKIASGSNDGTVKVWDAFTSKEINTFKGHTGYVGCVSFSPDGKKIVSGSSDNNLKVWNLETDKKIVTFDGNIDQVYSASFSPDGKSIASWGYNKDIRILNATTGQEIQTLKGHESWVACVNYSSDGKKIVSGSADNTIKVWDVISGQNILTLQGHTATVNSVRFSPTGLKIVSGSNDNTIKIWDASNGKEVSTIAGNMFEVYCVSFSPDAKKIVGGSSNWAVKVWDTVTSQEILTCNEHSSKVRCVTFSPDGKRIASGSLDKTIKIWNANDGKEIATLRGHTGPVKCVNFSPDGKRIVSGGEDKTLRIWDADSGQEILSLKEHTGGITTVSFSPDGKKIMSGGDDETLKIWDASTSQEIFTFKGEHGYSVEGASISPDGKKIVSWDIASIIKLWDVADDQVIFTIKSPEILKGGVRFSSDGKKILSKDINGDFSAWDTTSGAETKYSLTELDYYKNFTSQQFSADEIWSCEANGLDVILVNNKIREKRMKKDKEKLYNWSQPDLKWHSQNAEESEKNKQWFAAAFHLRKLIEIEPSNEAAKRRLQAAESCLKENK